MGGKAFAKQLPTPRMPLELFEAASNQVQEALRKIYTRVESPIEAPGKNDFGDVDVLITGALAKEYDPERTPWKQVADNIGKHLGAVATITGHGMPIVNLAIPWPDVMSEDLDHSTSIEEQSKAYVQVDVHHLHSVERFRWELFHSAHGDMWNILGSTIRRFGLTVTDKGLYLRIPEIELLDKNKAKVFLTENPQEVLEFVGLDPIAFGKPFQSQEEMFEYAAGCKLFWVKEKEKEKKIENEFEVVGDVPPEAGQEGGEAGKKKLKHNDRQRMAKRPIFDAWINDFIPRCREEGRYTVQKTTREEIRDEAFKKFGVQKQYEDKLAEWKLVQHRNSIWNDAIKGSVPQDFDPQFRGAACKVLKGVIMNGKEFEGVVPEASKLDENGFLDSEAVKGFVEANWRKAGEIGMARNNAKALKMQKEKEEKKLLQTQDEAVAM